MGSTNCKKMYLQSMSPSGGRQCVDHVNPWLRRSPQGQHCTKGVGGRRVGALRAQLHVLLA
jgi:hypothetical protein